MINFTTETQGIQRKPKREWTRIDANRGTKRHKTNRGWTQIIFGFGYVHSKAITVDL